MSDGGKGDKPRPIVDRNKFESNWETIFGEKKKDEKEIYRLRQLEKTLEEND